jgi:hypothetical protein
MFFKNDKSKAFHDFSLAFHEFSLAFIPISSINVIAFLKMKKMLTFYVLSLVQSMNPSKVLPV